MKNIKTRKLMLGMFAVYVLAMFAIVCFSRRANAGAELDKYVKLMNDIESGKTVSNKGMSDDEFWNLIKSLEETEKAIETVKHEKVDVVRFCNEYFITNKKPGYLLFSKDEADDFYDYEMKGYSSKVLYNFSENTFINAGFTRNFAAEYETDQVNLSEVKLSLTQRLFTDSKFNLNLKHSALSTDKELNGYGMEYSTGYGAYQFGFGVLRDAYASDLASYENPAGYYRYTGRIGRGLTGELYFELCPAFENYYNDKNRKKEISSSLLYFPVKMPRLSLEIYGKAVAFDKESGDNGSFVYFSPKNSSNIGLGLNHSTAFSKATKLNLGFNFERNKYKYYESATGYYVASVLAGLNSRYNKNVGFNFNYGFSVARTEDFPFTQNLKMSLEVKF